MLTTVGGSSPVAVGCSGVTTLSSELGHRSTEVRIIAGHVIIVFAVDLAQLSETHADNADALAEYSGHVRDQLAVRWRSSNKLAPTEELYTFVKDIIIK